MHILLRLLLLIAITLPVSAQQSAPSAPPAKSPFTFQEVMVPMRDGVRLQTVILIPVDQKAPLPILLTRTPYGVRDKAPDKMPASIKERAQDGYIFVSHNLRGRFKSEGIFNLSSWVDLNRPTDGIILPLTMSLTAGTILGQYEIRSPLGMYKAIDYTVQISHGFAAAHDRGIVHRDQAGEPFSRQGRASKNSRLRSGQADRRGANQCHDRSRGCGVGCAAPDRRMKDSEVRG